MSRTMSDKEREKFNAYIEKNRRELTKKQDIIEYLKKAGLCDSNGMAVYPYSNSAGDKR